MSFTFAPLLPSALLIALAAITACLVLWGIIGKLPGMFWRGLALALLILWMAGPQTLHLTPNPVQEDALLIVDHSPSMQVNQRQNLAEQAALHLQSDATKLHNLTLHRIDVSSDGHQGTRLFNALQQADIPSGHFSGAIFVTDGMNHDTPPTLPERFKDEHGKPLPLHLLLTAKREETDRRLRVLSAPPFAIIGQNATIRVQIDDLGTSSHNTPTTLTIRTGDTPPSTQTLQTGTPQEITLPIQHAGETLISLSTPSLAGEASTLNNSAVIRIRGVRDRLRVLLVSGIPNQSERVWRRLLKADPSVDLVHFTILRSPSSDDNTPLSDLALIPFPIRELFQDKINSFDLIILDSFSNTNILPERYLTNIANYVRHGGGLLVTAGPEFVHTGTLQDSPLSQILPAHVPDDAVIIGSFKATLAPLGHLHPVTDGLNPNWGPWYRALRADTTHGEDLMNGPDGTPLLLLDHVDQGRVALLLSDQLWLWSRNEGGGGPQAELLRRLAHWLMKEPDLEENRLTAAIDNGTLNVERHAVGTTNIAPQALVTAPDGQITPLPLTEENHVWRGHMPVSGNGIWTIHQDGLTAFASPTHDETLELQDLRATAQMIGPLAQASGGAIAWLAQDGTPTLNITTGQEYESGSKIISLPQRTDTNIESAEHRSIFPGWAVLPLFLLCLALGWWREGR
ncbi:hypothetical protein AA106555_0275 [Neokomagataea thailandica NBRC 106555]|uniref:VWA domain-containing protein n=2 Tax=Neokomagataea TaxID=1223423 RepID=A0A4Y6V6E3_9PROT|nr:MULTISPECIES: VWA domain-containing protein [Neokomagataea]QDH24171.1 VWA domain-containing protein [Neokomagataea tanensis]GBR50614.1 hypothetical protein AA106555_0275 [Neokomagataea thailandica NBRC 106555]